MKLYFGCVLLICLAWAVSGNQKKTTCNCGWVNRGRIVGGKETKKNEYPAMVSIQMKYFNVHICGGTIISPWHVLTAAHCTYAHATEEDIVLLVAAHNLEEAESNPRIGVSKIILHEGYNASTQLNDIAVIVPEERLAFSQNIGPSCFPISRDNLVGKKVTAIGWGLTKYKGEYTANTLQSVDLTVVDHASCMATWADSRSIKRPNAATNVCTFEVKKDTCKGDSGGPLLWLDPEIKRYTIIGLVSYGSVCGGQRAAVNTDVAAYSDWINKAIQDSKPTEQVCKKSEI